jgi:hypothetical protein
MARSAEDFERSERLLTLIENRFKGRGKFQQLEEVSNIPASKWKNLFYKKQAATPEQIGFWIHAYPDDRHLFVSEVETKVSQRDDSFARGYFFAVAVALRAQGPTKAVRKMFAEGGDPARAEEEEKSLFRHHGLMT